MKGNQCEPIEDKENTECNSKSLVNVVNEVNRESVHTGDSMIEQKICCVDKAEDVSESGNCPLTNNNETLTPVMLFKKPVKEMNNREGNLEGNGCEVKLLESDVTLSFESIDTSLDDNVKAGTTPTTDPPNLFLI